MLLLFVVVIFLSNAFAQKIIPSFYLRRDLEGTALSSINTAQILSKTRDYDLGYYRLPNNSQPLSYDLTITTKVDKKDMSFNGKVLIEIEILEKTREITLHANSLDIKKVDMSKIEDDSNPLIEELEHDYEDKRNFLFLKRKDDKPAFEKDSKWQLYIEYTGTVRTDNLGFYLSSYTDVDNKVQ